MAGLEGIFGWFPVLLSGCALIMLVIGVGALFKRRWARSALGDLRRAHADDSGATDPQNGAARALTLGAATDQRRWSAADRLSDGDSGSSDGGGGD